MSGMSLARLALVAIGLCAALPATAMGGVVLDGYPHPQAASPVRVSFVPSFNTCTAPNRTHGPPLAHPSCSPPLHTSNSITVGTPDNNAAAPNFGGSARWKVISGAPGPPDDSDVLIAFSLVDIRCRPGVITCGTANSFDGPDYTGEVELRFPFRLTDHFNAVAPGGGTETATMIDIVFPIITTCDATAVTSIGATCASTTTLNAVVPGSVKDGKRAIWEFGKTVVFDAGDDGVASTTPNTQFASQGIFVP